MQIKILQKIKIYLQERKRKRLEKERSLRQLGTYLDSIGKPEWVTGRKYENVSSEIAYVRSKTSRKQVEQKF